MKPSDKFDDQIKSRYISMLILAWNYLQNVYRSAKTNQWVEI